MADNRWHPINTGLRWSLGQASFLCVPPYPKGTPGDNGDPYPEAIIRPKRDGEYTAWQYSEDFQLNKSVKLYQKRYPKGIKASWNSWFTKPTDVVTVDGATGNIYRRGKVYATWKNAYIMAAAVTKEGVLALEEIDGVVRIARITKNSTEILGTVSLPGDVTSDYVGVTAHLASRWVTYWQFNASATKAVCVKAIPEDVNYGTVDLQRRAVIELDVETVSLKVVRDGEIDSTFKYSQSYERDHGPITVTDENENEHGLGWDIVTDTWERYAVNVTCTAGAAYRGDELVVAKVRFTRPAYTAVHRVTRYCDYTQFKSGGEYYDFFNGPSIAYQPGQAIRYLLEDIIDQINDSAVFIFDGEEYEIYSYAVSGFTYIVTTETGWSPPVPTVNLGGDGHARHLVIREGSLRDNYWVAFRTTQMFAGGATMLSHHSTDSPVAVDWTQKSEVYHDGELVAESSTQFGNDELKRSPAQSTAVMMPLIEQWSGESSACPRQEEEGTAIFVSSQPFLEWWVSSPAPDFNTYFFGAKPPKITYLSDGSAHALFGLSDTSKLFTDIHIF